MNYQVMEWSKGNPGALTFLMTLLNSEKPDELDRAIRIIVKLEEAKSIRGTNLWVLYSDLCGKSLHNVEQLCANCPTDILEDACNRQDYSGSQLIKEYLK